MPRSQDLLRADLPELPRQTAELVSRIRQARQALEVMEINLVAYARAQGATWDTIGRPLYIAGTTAQCRYSERVSRIDQGPDRVRNAIAMCSIDVQTHLAQITSPTVHRIAAMLALRQVTKAETSPHNGGTPR